MKIVIISDIHSNIAALEALPEKKYDQIWCLGDLVDYGPQPCEVIQWIRTNANLCVRGNHDHAVGFDVDPECSIAFRKLAEETRRYTQQIASSDDIAYLRSLPVQRQTEVDGARFYLVHATPTNPLFGYCTSVASQWEEEVHWIDSDFLLVGHTHTPFVRRVGKTTVINPGSVGQPKTGRHYACYAVWENGDVVLQEYEYPISKTIHAIEAMPIPKEDQESLVSVLKTGKLSASYPVFAPVTEV